VRDMKKGKHTHTCKHLLTNGRVCKAKFTAAVQPNYQCPECGNSPYVKIEEGKWYRKVD